MVEFSIVRCNKIFYALQVLFLGCSLEFDNPERPECNNLLSIYQLISGRTKEVFKCMRNFTPFDAFLYWLLLILTFLKVHATIDIHHFRFSGNFIITMSKDSKPKRWESEVFIICLHQLLTYYYVSSCCYYLLLLLAKTYSWTKVNLIPVLKADGIAYQTYSGMILLIIAIHTTWEVYFMFMHEICKRWFHLGINEPKFLTTCQSCGSVQCLFM